MTDKLELKSCHEVIDTVDVANIESIFHGKPIDPDILTVVMKDGKRLYCDEVCPIDSLEEEPNISPVFDEGYWERLGEKSASKEIGDYDHNAVIESLLPELKEEPVSEDIEKEIDHAHKLFYEEVGWDSDEGARAYVADWFAYYFAKWQKEHLWKPADGDDLPEIDREVVALLDNGKVVFAHRPPEYWDGKDIVTGKVTRNYPKTYDKGGWNIPDIKWWLDCLLPNMEED